MKNILADRLRELRGSMSQSDFALKIGVKQTSYSSWERGVKDPAAQTLAQIASTFGVSADWLLGLSDERERSQVIVSQPRTVREPAAQFRGVTKMMSSKDDLVLAELTALKRRVAALESSTVLACG